MLRRANSVFGVTGVLLFAVASASAGTQVFFSPKGGCAGRITANIDRAKSTVRVQAYSFTSNTISDALIRAKNRGVDVRVILDSSWPDTAAKVESKLTAAGVTVLIDSKHAIAHNKLTIVDAAKAVTGSYNYTEQAENQNAENILITTSKSAIAAYAANWDAHAAHSLPPGPIPAKDFPHPTP